MTTRRAVGFLLLLMTSLSIVVTRPSRPSRRSCTHSRRTLRRMPEIVEGRDQGRKSRPRRTAPESAALDRAASEYLPLRALAAYSGLSVRTLRRHLVDRVRPLPCYRIGGKVLVRRSDIDPWATQVLGGAQEAKLNVASALHYDLARS